MGSPASKNSLYAVFLLIMPLLVLVSCKKGGDVLSKSQAPATTVIPVISPVATADTSDRQYLSGWWYCTEPANTKVPPVRYYGPDHVYFFDATSQGAATLTGGFSWGNKDTLLLGNNYNGIAEKAAILKLTKDSLFVPGGYKYYKVNSPLVTSKPINTAAGDGFDGLVNNNNNDGWKATEYSLGTPSDIVFDSNGNYYICDSRLNRVLKVNTKKIITTYFDTGIGVVDNQPPFPLTFSAPTGMAIDSHDNIYVTDLLHGYVQKISPAGDITTVAGTGLSADGGDGGLATKAHLNLPNKVAVDAAGNVYINDQHNYRIRKVNASDGKISTVAGTGIAGHTGNGGQATAAAITPLGLAVDAAGNLYIGETGSIRKVNAATGIITVIAGNGTAGYAGDRGPALQARLNAPEGLRFDKNGNLYIADSGNGTVREILAADGTIITIAGVGYNDFSFNGPHATFLALRNPGGVAVDANGNVYIADSNNHVIRRVGD